MKAIDTVYFQEFINIYKTSQKERANKGLGLQYFGPKEMQMLLDKIPIVDAEPVPHGQWRFDGAWMNEDGVVNDYFCSCCGRIISVDCKAELENYPYCHCGAKMDLKE